MAEIGFYGMTTKEIFKEFFAYLPRSPTPIQEIKILLSTHLFMKDPKCGRIFVQHFLQWDGWPRESPSK